MGYWKRGPKSVAYRGKFLWWQFYRPATATSRFSYWGLGFMWYNHNNCFQLQLGTWVMNFIFLRRPND